MTKVTLTDLVNLQNETTAVNAINGNNAILETAFDNTLSRDGTSPNKMSANLDMDSNRILNLPIPISSGEPVRLGDLEDFVQFQNSVDLAAALAQAQADAATSTTQAGIATTQAGIATTQAGNAAASAADAQDSADDAAASAAQAAAFVSSGQINVFSYIPPSEIPAIQARTSTYDAGPDINTALAAAQGVPLLFPAGTYKINTPIVFKNPAVGGTSYAPVLKGAGMNQTILLSSVAGATLTNTFSTTSGSAIITVNWPSHGKVPNDLISFINVNTLVGGLDMRGDWAVTAIPDANTLQFNHYLAASSTQANVGTVTYCKPTISIDSAGTFMIGTQVTGMTIACTGNPIGSTCLQMRRCWQNVLDDLWLTGAKAYGLHIPCVLGDLDGCIQTQMRQMRVSNCRTWGIKMDASASTVGGIQIGYNEISNTTMLNVTVDSCGSDQNTYTNGGGIKWKGQVIHMMSVAMTTCSNCGIFVPGQAGLASAFTFNTIVIENCTGRNFVVEGLDCLTGQLLEMYNNDSFIATTGIYLNGASFPVRNININSSIIRATAGNNAYTAFVGVAPNLGFVRIYTPSFQNFGYPGQAQASGITFI